MEDLWTRYLGITSNVETQILDYLSVGWTPTGGFDDDGRSVFNSSVDITRIPIREYPLTTLSVALLPLTLYSVVLISGMMLFMFCPKNTDGSKRQLIREDFLYPFKFTYNVVQIFLCAYMSVEALVIAKREGLLGFHCGTFYFEDPSIGDLLWLFYLSKILDFMDTVFIIASAKYNQFTFLHCFHHFTVYLFYWINVNINYDGGVYFTILANGFIHSVMYSYYWISMHIPKVKDPKTQKWKYGIWWKKYLTQMQLVQFILMMTQSVLLLGMGCGETPPRVLLMYFVYVFILFALFVLFYQNAYKHRKKKRD